MYQEWWLDLSTLFFFKITVLWKKKQLRSQNSEVHRLAVQAKAMHVASASGATRVNCACLYHIQGCNVLNALNSASWGCLNLSSVYCFWCLIYVRYQKKVKLVWSCAASLLSSRICNCACACTASQRLANSNGSEPYDDMKTQNPTQP